MVPLTVDALRTLAASQGLDLTDDELEGLLPLVEAGRSLVESLAGLDLTDVEPASQYRIV
jgi:hypothetical protein